MNVLLTVSYIGTRYCGWQVQNNALSVQAVLQQALEKMLGRRYPLTGCSRTDAGVHARMFCCTVSTDEKANAVPLDKWPQAVNPFLPDDIAVLKARQVPDSFHPRYDVIEKEYVYRIRNSSVRDPFAAGLAYLYPKRLDEETMQKAAQAFVGKKDFTACMAQGSDVTDCVRDVKYLRVKRIGEEITIAIAADGFLYNMVRIIVGTLIDVSTGRIPLDELPARIASRERSRMGFTAPACGLYLNKVRYQDDE